MPDSLRLIKKYPNRRLYDTKTSAYITLSDVKNLVLSFERFKVVDSKSSEDLTRRILLQIIVEEEAAGMPLLNVDLLMQLIRVDGQNLQGGFGHALETNIRSLSAPQGESQAMSR